MLLAVLGGATCFGAGISWVSRFLTENFFGSLKDMVSGTGSAKRFLVL
jgi:hypothetical protein